MIFTHHPFCFVLFYHTSLLCLLLLVIAFFSSSSSLSIIVDLSVISILRSLMALWWRGLSHHSVHAYGCILYPQYTLKVAWLDLSLAKLYDIYCAHETTEIFIRDLTINFLIWFIIEHRLIQFADKLLEFLESCDIRLMLITSSLKCLDKIVFFIISLIF